MSLFGSLAQTVLLKAYPFRAGRKELIRALARRYDTPFLWSGDWGIRYLLRTRNFLDQSLARDGHYEAAAVDGLCWQINRRGVDLFLDIGAASGIYSLTVAKRTGCRDIVAFEPDP
ncbi:MAG: hypothetical protein K2Q10_00105, partial [Rhodospirillales bacterium]|nr:hypothetical protein [Rhodospirillales bacterium]